MNPANHNAENARTARNAVMACPSCYSGAKLVFLNLANAADIDGLSGVDRSFVPFESVLAMTPGKDRTTVLRALQRLAQCGHVQILQLPSSSNGYVRHRNLYRVVMP